MATRKDVIDAVWERLPELTRVQAAAVVDALFAAIARALGRGERVTIPGFGSFSLGRRAARRGRNPATGAPIAVAAAVGVRFKPLPALAGAVSRKAATRSARRSPATRGFDSLELAEGPPEPRRDLGTDFSVRRSPLGEKPSYVEVEVHYATDRAPTGRPEPARFFGWQRSRDGLHYGVCAVSIPRDHKLGRLESPSIRRFEFRADPEKHVVLLSISEESHDDFFAGLAGRVAAGRERQLLVFVHGFNVTFEDAARRTAQIAYDLQFPGPPVVYSWPSRGALSRSGYSHDENSVAFTRPHLVAFLDELATRSGAERIHLIAHSMGNRPLTEALEVIALRMAGGDRPRFSEVILTAPDVDADAFRAVAAAIQRAARQVTLYASERDRALEASESWHGGYPRAGDGGADVVVVPGVDTIEASAVDTDLVGHFYYAENRSVLSDVFYLIRDRLAPERRFNLRPREKPGPAGGRYWVFTP